MTKEELRQIIREKRASFSCQEREAQSQHIWKTLCSLPQYATANSILCYWSLPDEVSTHRFVEKAAASKQIFLPVISGENLLLRQFTSVDRLTVEPSFKIAEPSKGNREVAIEQIELIIVPGVAFDRSNNRLGRGKGFYDRLLAHSKAMKIGVCFDFQLFDKIPSNSHDIAMDKVICGSILQK